MSKWPLPAAFLALLLALAAIAPASANPPCGVGNHPACETPSPQPTPSVPPSDPDMAVVNANGFEINDTTADQVNFNGTCASSTTQARTGTRSIRCNPASGASGWLTSAATTSGWVNIGVYIATLPSVARMMFGTTGAGFSNILLNADGTLTYRVNTTASGTSAALQTGRWYWLGIRWNLDGANTVLLQIDGADAITGVDGTSRSANIGFAGTEASAVDVYFDDMIWENAGFLNPSRVGLAKPISDNSRVDWTNDAAGTSNLFDALDNTPPVGIADTTGSTGLHQIRDATNGTDTYVANMTTYATLGLTTNDKVLSVEPFALTGAPSATSPKSGSLTVSNPTIAKTSMGTFYQGSSIAGTYPSGWILHTLGITASPTITVANSPVITITQDTSSTRIAMVCGLYMYVAWTPGALGKITNVSQAVARAANY